jgi:long-subunit acyl-CoA synthetase (AMP-forming)
MLAECHTIDTDFHSTRVDRRTNPHAPIRSAPIVLEENVWISEGVGILPGAWIGANSVVGIRAVCVRRYPPEFDPLRKPGRGGGRRAATPGGRRGGNDGKSHGDVRTKDAAPHAVESGTHRVNIARLLWETAAGAPSRIAIQDGARSLDYAALAGRAAAIRDALDASGTRPGDRVAILLPHGADSAAAFYGATAAGAVATVINWLYRPRQVEAVLEHAEVGVLVTTREWAALQTRPLEGATRLLFVEDVPCHRIGGPLRRRGASPAQITYTSGSSGGPKGVVMSHDNLLAGIRTVVGYLGITAEDRIASVLPFSFVYGFNQLNCAIATPARSTS